MSDKIVELGSRLHRRTLLAKVAAGAVGVTLGLLGQGTRVAATYRVFCCDLCVLGGCDTCFTCAWCWSCLHSDGYWYQCCECHYTNDGCTSGSCTNVRCSWARQIGNAPARQHAAVAGQKAA